MDATQISLLIAGVGLVINFVVLVISAVVVVMNVKGVTLTLAETIKGLKLSVDHLRAHLERVDARTNRHAEDLAVLKANRSTECKP